MRNRFTEYPDRREWDLSDFVLDQVCLDYRVTLLFVERLPRGVAQPRPADAVTVIIEQALELRANERAAIITPELTVAIMPLLPLLHQPAAELTVFRSGRLLIKFTNGAKIDVPRHEQYEAWQTFGTGNVTDISMECTPHPVSPWGG